jgi:hypothetical protein
LDDGVTAAAISWANPGTNAIDRTVAAMAPIANMIFLVIIERSVPEAT